MKRLLISVFVMLSAAVVFAQQPVKTIVLDGSDRRIALYGDGTWSWLASDGSRVAPSAGEKLTLAADGTWAITNEAGVQLPDIQKSWDVVKARNINTHIPNGGPERLNSGVASSTSSASSSSGNGGSQYYTVKSGDTLSGIAARHHTTVSKICQLNGIKSTTTLQIGKKLKIK